MVMAPHGVLHVVGAEGFLAGGDLLGEVGGGVDLLPELHVVIRQEHHPQTTIHIGIGVDGLGDAVDGRISLAM